MRNGINVEILSEEEVEYMFNNDFTFSEDNKYKTYNVVSVAKYPIGYFAIVVNGDVIKIKDLFFYPGNNEILFNCLNQFLIKSTFSKCELLIRDTEINKLKYLVELGFIGKNFITMNNKRYISLYKINT